jgi:hypothetical protein
MPCINVAPASAPATRRPGFALAEAVKLEKDMTRRRIDGGMGMNSDRSVGRLKIRAAASSHVAHQGHCRPKTSRIKPITTAPIPSASASYQEYNECRMTQNGSGMVENE